ncbi:MAG: MFS transporter [Sphaerochaeta sp.]|nr:MFS transporter [Sphaerochaeta sp.]
MGIRNLQIAMLVVAAFGSNLFGGLSSEIQETCSLSLSQMSNIMSLSQAANLISFLLLPLLVRQFGPYPLMIFGIVGSGLGLLGMGMSRTAYVFGFAFLFNTLMGYFYSTSNFTVLVRSDPKKIRTTVPLAHLTWSLASVASGFYISLIKDDHWYRGYYQIAFVYAVMVVLFLFSASRAKKIPQMFSDTSERKPFIHSFSLLKTKNFRLFFLYLILFNAVEYCCTVYTLLFLQKNLGASAKQIGLALSLMYLGSTLSRVFVIPIVRKSGTPFPLLQLLSALSVFSILALSLGSSLIVAFSAMVVIGFSFGALNPASQIVEIMCWPQEMDQIANLHSISMVLGRMVLPSLFGVVSLYFSLQGGLVFLSLCMIFASFFLFLFKRLQSSYC